MLSAFQSAVSQMITFSEEEGQKLLSFCYHKSYKKKELISDIGQPVNEVYFVSNGLVRVKITDLDGKEHTTHFAIENQFISDYTAFLQHGKSTYQMEALEDTELIVLPREGIDWGYANMKEGQKLGRLIAEYYFMYMDTRIQRLYTLSPIERYEYMNEVFPNIHNRVPQHMIASYLGITPIHLSRIKRKAL